MTEEFKKWIEEYISKCDSVVTTTDMAEAKFLEKSIVNAFEGFIPGLKNNLDFSWGNKREVDYIGNIKKLREKLKGLLFTNGSYKIGAETEDNKEPSVVVNTNNSISGSGNSTNTNTNTQNQTVNNTFDIKAELDNVRKELEDDESLGEADKEEINEKINEIEAVMNGSPTNNDKWRNLKDVINWVTTKGFKIGKLIMPVITKALFHEG